MEAVENLVRDEKIRFLASSILFKGAPQIFEDVCSDCRLFSVTPAELLEFTFVPIKFGNCQATALFIPFPGSVYVTQEFCQEIGRKSILTPFSLYQNQGGKWLRKIYPVAPPLTHFEKTNTPSRPVIGESTSCQVPNVDGATLVLPTRPVGESHVLQRPTDGETVLTHTGSTDRSVRPGASHWPMDGGSVLSQVRKVETKTSFLAEPLRGSTEFSTCPSNCESASSQGPTNDGLGHQEDELGHEGLLQRHDNAFSSTCRVRKIEGVTPAFGPLAAGKHYVPKTGRRSKAAQKSELKTEAWKVEVEGGIAYKSGPLSRVTRSAAANLPTRDLETVEKNRERDPYANVGDKETPEKRKRGRMKGLMAPVAVKEEKVQGDFINPVSPDIHPVNWPELGHPEVVGETRISLSGTEKSGIADLENPVQAQDPTTEAGSPRKPRKKRRKAGLWTVQSTRKASAKHGGMKAVTINPSPVVFLATPGLTGNQFVHGPVLAVGRAVDLEVRGGTRVSSSGSEKSVGEVLEYCGNAVKTEEEFAGKINKPSTCFYGGTGAVTPCRNGNLSTPEKSTPSERAQLLYVSDSEENSSTAELPSTDVKVHTSSLMHAHSNGAHDGPPRLSAALPGAGKSSLDTEMMKVKGVNDNAVNSPEVEEATATEVGLRTGSRQQLTRINDLLRQMNTIITSSSAEHVEGACTTRLAFLDEERSKFTVPEEQLCASLQWAEFAEGAPLDRSVGGVIGSGNSFINESGKQPVGQIQHCGKSHGSLALECVHYDVDDFAAFAKSSHFVKVARCQAFCNSGEDNGTCAEPGDEIMERNTPSHAGVIAYGLNTKGATLGARDERPVSGLKRLKDDHQRRGISGPSKRIKNADEEPVCGEESCTGSHISLDKPPVVRADHALIPSECRGLAIEEETSNLSCVKTALTLFYEAPIIKSKRFEDDKCAKLSRVVDIVGCSAVSQSVLSTQCALGGSFNITDEDSCSRKVVLEEDQLKGHSRIEREAVVSVVTQKEATSSYAVTAARSEHTYMFGSAGKTALAAKLNHLEGYRIEGSPAVKGNVRFVPMERGQVGVEEGTHVKQRLGELLGLRHHAGRSEIGGETSLAGDAVNVQSANYPSQLRRDTPNKDFECKKKLSSTDQEMFTLEPGPLIPIDGTGDTNSKKAHPGNKPGTSVGKNSGELNSKGFLAVQKAVVPASVNVKDPTPKQKNQELKIVPEFDNYTVIGEEGSGGYGTVYKVMNNATERIYAMKCPLIKTHPTCVENEIRMLQQLGGKECIIKFEKVVPGRFRTSSGSGEKLSECKSILLEFMEHDKPEVLKKEITIEELRNYSLCLFRALAHMHRLRSMHLDVKPGNFLFSRSKRRGCLVDFNLARDEQKQPKRMKVLPSSSHIICRMDSSRSSKRPPVQDLASTPVSYSKRSRLLMGASKAQLSYGTPSPARTLSVLQDYSNKSVGQGVSADMKVSSPRLPDLAPSRSATPMGVRSSSRRTAESQKPSNEHGDPGARQHCEGSADVQQNHTLGPRPQSGHRALLKYIQTKVYNQQPPVFSQQLSPLPASQRKRVAAVQNKKKFLAAGSVPVTQHASQPSIARRLKAPVKPKGYNDQIKDGPCVGTKGYRAPEVLLRSLKQTTKVDIWSAGVSLLQLISGRSPFSSTSTDGALQDIAKVRGSDKVLALATRHQRQHSISKELCAMRYPPTTLKEWCEKHSRRSDLKGKIPPELFDLLEKCLDVDPVSRITAEEALNHQFCATL